MKQEVNKLEELKASLTSLGATAEDVALIDGALKQLQDLCLLVVVGEFNSGKYLKEGITPTTHRINILRYGSHVHESSADAETVQVSLPVDWLREITLVDTPGTNAVIRGHQQITEHFVPRSDLVLFVTSVDRAFSESEGRFLDNIAKYSKKIVVIITKIDLVERAEDEAEVEQFVKSQFKARLNMEPTVFKVSSKDALRAKQAGGVLTENPAWVRSRFGPLEHFIFDSLDSGQRALLKLTNPLGISSHLITKYRAIAAQQSEVLGGDRAALASLQPLEQEFLADLRRDFEYQLLRTDNILLRLAERGQRFLDSHLRVSRLPELLNQDALKKAFEQESSVEIQASIDEVAGWLAAKNARHLAQVVTHLRHHSELSNSKLRFTEIPQREKAEVLAGLGTDAQHLAQAYDRRHEAQVIAAEVRSALFQTAAIEATAAGVGTLLAASVLDLTGILGVSLLAATGLAILPYRRALLKASLETQIQTLRGRYRDTLEKHLGREEERIRHNSQQTVRPFAQYLEHESQRLEAAESSLEVLEGHMTRLREQLHHSFAKKAE